MSTKNEKMPNSIKRLNAFLIPMALPVTTGTLWEHRYKLKY